MYILNLFRNVFVLMFGLNAVDRLFIVFWVFVFAVSLNHLWVLD